MNPVGTGREGYFGDISRNLLLFCQQLRKRKVSIPTDKVLDTLKAITFIDIRLKEDFYILLRACLVSAREDIPVFDELFDEFWSLQTNEDVKSPEISREKTKGTAEEKIDASLEPDKSEGTVFKEWVNGDNESPSQTTEILGYSPDDVLGHKDFGRLQPEDLERVKEYIAALARKASSMLSRRWKKGKSGDRLDFRKTIRQSLKYGGDLIELRKKERKKKPVRLIILGDVSGSMDIYTHFFLLFVYGIQNYYPHCESFVFSTKLTRVTQLLKGKSFSDALRLLSERVPDWAGGTNIGAALHELRLRYPHLLLTTRSVLMILSDGWDRGDMFLLESEMRNLKRQTKRLVWLNPLLGSRDYKPLCKGMSTALPYLDYFLPCHNLASLKKLTHLISTI